MSEHDQELATPHGWRMHTGAGRVSRQLRERPERRWPFLTWPFFLAQLLIAKEVLAATLDRQDDTGSDDAKQGSQASPDAGAEGADAAAMRAAASSEVGNPGEAPSNASFLVANPESPFVETKPATPPEQSADASARSQSESPGSSASGGALAFGGDGSSGKDSSCGDSGQGCCDPDSGCSPAPAHPIGSGELLPGIGVELPPNIGVDLPPVLGIELPPVIAINLPPVLGIDISLGGNPTGSGTGLLPNLGLGLGDPSLGVSVATPILDADIGLNLGFNNSLALDVRVGGEPLLHTLGVEGLTDLLGPTTGSLDPNVAISALQDIGLQTGAVLTEIGLPAPVEAAQNVVSSGASLVADVVDFAPLQIRGVLSAGGNLGFADTPANTGPQVNELFDGVTYTDYNITLQSVETVTTQPLVQAPVAVVETVLDPLALHEVASHPNSGNSQTASDPVHLPLTVSLDELSLRAISI